MIEKIATPKRTIEIIHKYDFAFQKRFGQNFIVDQNILNKIISGAQLTKEDVVIEIGPGIGSLTQALAENSKKVIAIEIDKKLIPILEDTLAEYDNIVLINDDILKADLKELIRLHGEERNIKVIANLPYYITTPIIMGLFEKHVPIHSITVMVQTEVATRMQAKPGKKDYGALSLAVQYYSEPHIITHVPPNCFIPAPKVGSSVIQLTKRNTSLVNVGLEEQLFELIKAAFNQRRKTLINSVCNQEQINYTKEQVCKALKTMGLNEKIRGESLTLEQFISLTEILNEN